jgi:F-type H+-transporting ATPase subunit gamma
MVTQNMETLESLSRRLSATEDLQSLVRSMKTLSAASIRQFEKAEGSLKLFRRTIDLGLQTILRDRPVIRPGVHNNDGGGTVLIVFGSDRGLCGSFNENAAELAYAHLGRLAGQDGPVHVLAVGSQIAARMTTLDREPDEVMSLPGSVQGLAKTCETILIRIDRLRETLSLNDVQCVFNQRGPEGEISPRTDWVLPIPIEQLQTLAHAHWPSRRLPTYSVDLEMLFSWLIRQHLFTSLYSAGLASMASENAARLASMQNAERNISEHLEAMTAEFRRLRQDAITTELMDIVGGYEVIKQRSLHRHS